MNRYTQLDSLRGIAAFTVFFSHFVNLFDVKLPFYNYIEYTPLHLLWDGHAAVTFFFVLSGFVLSLPFVNSDRQFDLVPFYIKRIFRIYPAFIFALIIAVILKTFFFNHAQMEPFSVWIKNFWQWDWNRKSVMELLKTTLLIGPHYDKNFIIPVIWSLVIEMIMSLILPFFIVITSKNNLLFNVLFFVLIIFLTKNGNASILGVFYLGVLIAKYKEILLEKLQLFNKVSILGLFILAIVLYTCNFSLKLESKADLSLVSDYIIAIGASIILVLSLRERPFSFFLKKPLFVFLGNISYSFYLVHLPVLMSVSSIISLRNAFDPIYIFMLSLLISVAISYIMYRFIEKPFQSLGKMLLSRLHPSDFLKQFNIS